MSATCIVVIPVYKSLDVDEVMSIKQLLKMTPNFQKIFAVPLSFDLDETYNDFKEIEIHCFSDYYFKDIQGYNQLMLSKEFYERFSAFDYILIHQTDAYLFKDELAYWCSLNYDYIGAPWYTPGREGKEKWYKFCSRHLKWLLSYEDLIRRRAYNSVGNGGLSLRKVTSFLKVLSEVKESLMKKYIDNESVYFNEDLFWSIEAPIILSEYNIPDMEVAMHFALESEAQKLYLQMNSKLPFGCHGYKKGEADFWKRHIPYQLDK